MPRIRLTYHRDITREGTDTLDVSEGRARVLVSERRAVVIEPADVLAEFTKAELSDRAAHLGLDVPARASKSDLIGAIREAETG